MVPHTYVNTRISYVSLVQDYYYAEIGLKDTLKPKMLCDADIVASAVFRNLVDSLRVSYRLHGGSGTVFFPKRSVDRDAFEILDMDCDLHHPSRNGFEIAPSELKEKLNAARNEFLGVGDDAASWFLFKHESVVQREGVETLVRIIEDQNPSFCFVEKPCRGCGATTLIRNVLYNLRFDVHYRDVFMFSLLYTYFFVGNLIPVLDYSNSTKTKKKRKPALSRIIYFS